MKQKIVFFGSSKHVIPILEVLQKNFDLKLVLTTEHLALQGLALQPPVIKYCVENKIPYLSVSSFSDPDLKLKIENLKLKIAILADFGLIIPKEILSLFPMGIINIHPSFLPKYRGPTPVQTAILNGDKTTGVSIIKLDEKMDHGPILSQIEEEILPDDTSESLNKRLFKIGSGSIVDTIKLYLKGKINPREQNHEEAIFTKPLTRQSGFINPENSKFQIPNSKLNLMIRAYFPWPGVWTKLMINDPASSQGGKSLRIKFLPEKKIQVEGKKPVSYKDFINGYAKGGKILTKLDLL